MYKNKYSFIKFLVSTRQCSFFFFKCLISIFIVQFSYFKLLVAKLTSFKEASPTRFTVNASQVSENASSNNLPDNLPMSSLLFSSVCPYFLTSLPQLFMLASFSSISSLPFHGIHENKPTIPKLFYTLILSVPLSLSLNGRCLFAPF